MNANGGAAPPAPAGEQGSLRAAVARKGSFGQTLKAVAWSFFGIRKSSEYEKDVSQLNPVHVILAGLIGAGVFVTTLVLVVNWVIGSGAAGGG